MRPVRTGVHQPAAPSQGTTANLVSPRCNHPVADPFCLVACALLQLLFCKHLAVTGGSALPCRDV